MRAEIRRVCKEFNLTTVYVTHDQKEALSISDRMAILESGHILQVGSPREVYRRPTRKTVAHFIGETDFIAGTVVSAQGERALVETALGKFEGVLGDPTRKPADGAAVTLSVRPECWRLGAESVGPNTVAGHIGESVYLGETAQHAFAPTQGGEPLKIFELNPRFLGQSANRAAYASAEIEDVVVLID